MMKIMKRWLLRKPRKVRRAVLLLTDRLLMNMLTPLTQRERFCYQVVDDGLPIDARIVRSYWSGNAGNGCLAIVLESEKFAEVDDGQMLPFLPSVIIQSERIEWEDVPEGDIQ